VKTVAYKAFTRILCSPIQGGPPIWDGSLPHRLPRVVVDRSQEECAAGWNACRTPADALRIAGLWPDGWPSRIFRASTSAKVEERKDKLRASTWTITHELGEAETREAIEQLSAPFGEHSARMVEEQIAWRSALARPQRDPGAIEAGLRTALERRGLSWTIKRYESARDAWAARAAWDARAARDAWDALTVCYVSLMGWISSPPDLLTAGLRDAYAAGLALAIPTGPDELGWAMEPPPDPQAEEEKT
jgi:hypothetical protein